MKPKVKITITEANQLQELCNELEFNINLSKFDRLTRGYCKTPKLSLFERFYNSITNLISNGKSFAPNELKTFR